MARNMYGATSADFTLTSGGRVVPGATLTVWTARTGGTQVTDLLDANSVACTTVTSGADGSVVFYGVDAQKDTLWLDSGQGSRIAVRPVDITGETGATPALTIGTVGTGAAAATITGTDEDPVLNLTIPPAANDSITSVMIAADAVGTSEIAANAVGASELADNAVDTAAIQDSAVTSAKIADGTIVAADVAADTFAAFGTVGNLLTANQASGTDTLGDTTGLAANGSATLTSSTERAKSGSRSLKIVTPGSVANEGFLIYGADAVALSNGNTYTWSAWVYSVAGGTYRVGAYRSGGVINAASTFHTVPAGAWTKVTHVFVATGDIGSNWGPVSWGAMWVDTATTRAETFYVDQVSVHKGAGGVWQSPGAVVPGTSRIAVNNAVDLSGTGVPEGVVTAAPGSSWLQIGDAVTVSGNLLWRKATGTGNTGWVPEGALADTGWRDVSATHRGSGWTAGTVQIRRIGKSVRVRANGLTGAATFGTLWTVSAAGWARDWGYQAVTGVGRENAVTGLPYWFAFDGYYGGLINGGAWSASYAINPSAEWLTADAWPTSLPGSAA